MVVIDKYSIQIKIELSNGVYIFNNESATGKTRLLKLLKQYRTVGEKVAGYTYSDKQAGLPPESCFRDNPEVVMFDRYDMYKGYADKIIEKHCRDSIILIDLKCDQAIVPLVDDWCTISLTDNAILVSGE